ncbi:MAG TPA: hypothetical protein VJR23_10905 [Candidatus Acidoferrales bacterium]|nr:hypothetical protein [Candidatus Acidoferrales bacterium]
MADARLTISAPFNAAVVEMAGADGGVFPPPPPIPLPPPPQQQSQTHATKAATRAARILVARTLVTLVVVARHAVARIIPLSLAGLPQFPFDF